MAKPTQELHWKVQIHQPLVLEAPQSRKNSTCAVPTISCPLPSTIKTSMSVRFLIFSIWGFTVRTYKHDSNGN